MQAPTDAYRITDSGGSQRLKSYPIIQSHSNLSNATTSGAHYVSICIHLYNLKNFHAEKTFSCFTSRNCYFNVIYKFEGTSNGESVN